MGGILGTSNKATVVSFRPYHRSNNALSGYDEGEDHSKSTDFDHITQDTLICMFFLKLRHYAGKSGIIPAKFLARYIF